MFLIHFFDFFIPLKSKFVTVLKQINQIYEWSKNKWKCLDKYGNSRCGLKKITRERYGEIERTRIIEVSLPLNAKFSMFILSLEFLATKSSSH